MGHDGEPQGCFVRLPGEAGLRATSPIQPLARQPKIRAEPPPTARNFHSLSASPPNHRRPLIGVTSDLVDDQVRVRRTYFRALEAGGAVAVPLTPLPGTAAEVLPHLDGLVMSGGDDPDTTAFGQPLHPEASLVDPDRQSFELELLDLLADRHSDLPVLAVCLGMQLLGLHAGGVLDQHLPDSLGSAEDHADGRTHPVSGTEFNGLVYSRHRQALVYAGGLDVVATAPDGVIEAVRCPRRPHVVGVQWHPERTQDSELGRALFTTLVDAAREGGT